MDITSQVPVPVPPALMESAASGFHPLFDAATIRRAFSRLRSGLLSQAALQDAHRAQSFLERFERLDEKREYLSVLPDDTVDVLVFLYFRTLDAWIAGQDEFTLH